MLRFLLATYLALGLLYLTVTPPFEASDEIHHYPVVRHIALGNGLPVQEIGVKTAWAQEGSQPPAYYLLSAALTFWIDTSDFDSVHVYNPFARIGIPGTPENANYTRSPAEVLVQGLPLHGTFLAVYAIRLLSLLMGAGTVSCAYALALTLAPKQKYVALVSASLVAFNPMFLFISASVNNDNLVWLLASLSLLLCVHLVQGPSRLIKFEIGDHWWQAPALGLLLGLAALTKISGLILLPIGGLALALQAGRTRQWRRFLLSSSVIAVVVLGVAGWWYVRNLTLYGELLGLDRMVAIAGARTGTVSVFDIFGEWRGFLYSFWGLFGAFTILAPSWTYMLWNVLALVGLVGLVWRGIRSPRSDRWQVASHALLILFIGLTSLGVIRWTLMTLASQGRLIFTALASLAFYFALGLTTWWPATAARRYLASGLVGLIGLVALVIPVGSIARVYVPPAPLTESQLPVDLQPVYAQLAPSVELIGYTLDPHKRYHLGEALTVTLYWRALDKIDADYNLFLHVLARDRLLVGNIDSWPGGGLRPTSFWQSGEIYPDEYHIQLIAADETLSPSTLRLDIAMWQNDSSQPFPIQSLDGQPVPSVTVAAGLLEPGIWPSVQPREDLAASFEGGISLVGFSLPDQVSVGEQFTLTLLWQATNTLVTDYTVFVHVTDTTGTLVAQSDGPPLNGFWPTSVWLPDQQINDPHLITISTPGIYHLLVGLYDPATVIPLIATRADGSEWPDRAVDLGTVAVK